MATQAQIDQIVATFHRLRPTPFFQKMNEAQAGIGAVMGFLYMAKEPVTAGNIADFMNVSTARVAVLLKKMVAKGLIIKERDASDARVTIVRLSEEGALTARRMDQTIQEKVGQVIDQVGMERMQEFLRVAEEIGHIFPKPEDMEKCME